MFLSDRLLSLTARVFVHVNVNISFIFVAYSSVVPYSKLPYMWPQGIIHLYIYLKLKNVFALAEKIG